MAKTKAKKSISISIDKLKEVGQDKKTVFQIRIEPELIEAFKEVCETELETSASSALREMIRQVCEQYGYDV